MSLEIEEGFRVDGRFFKTKEEAWKAREEAVVLEQLHKAICENYKIPWYPTHNEAFAKLSDYPPRLELYRRAESEARFIWTLRRQIFPVLSSAQRLFASPTTK